jgi:uncharacterized protein (DUF1330 family)
MYRPVTLGLTAIVSAALGAAAVQGLHAQGKPPAFAVGQITVTNEDGYTKEYLPAATKSIQDGGGRFIARGGKTLVLDGPPPLPRVTIVQFESFDKLQAFANSAAYKDAQAIGHKYGTFQIFAVEGVSP